MPGKAWTHQDTSELLQPRPPCDGNLQLYARLELSHPIRLCWLLSPDSSRRPPHHCSPSVGSRAGSWGSPEFPGVQTIPGSLHLPRVHEGVGIPGEGKAGESSPLPKSKKGDPKALPARSGGPAGAAGGGGAGCNCFCLRWAKRSGSISRKRLFWSELQNIVFAQLNSPACAFSLKSQQLSGRRFPSSLPLRERQCSSPQPISELGSGVKGLPEFMALIAETLPSGAGIERCTQGSPPQSSVGHPGDNQVFPTMRCPNFPHHHQSPGSPLCARLLASFLLRPDSLQLLSRPPRISPQSHHGFVPLLAGLQGWRRSPRLSSPVPAQPQLAQAALPRASPIASLPPTVSFTSTSSAVVGRWPLSNIDGSVW